MSGSSLAAVEGEQGPVAEDGRGRRGVGTSEEEEALARRLLQGPEEALARRREERRGAGGAR